MCCPSGCAEGGAAPAERYLLADGVRLRPVEEAGVCLAYTRARPALHRLNVTGWLLVSLCDGRPVEAVAAAYRAAAPGPSTDDASVHAALTRLAALGILRRAGPPDENGETT